MSLAYRADIDGLRALAVLLVVGFHAYPQWVPGGFIGVDVFFVISGFLITGILLGELQGSGMGLLAFYGRRVLRIFPALILVLSACLFLGWHVLLAHEYKQLGKHIAAGAGFLSNIALWFEAGYFDAASEAKPLLHLWSLGIEEQFYIVWPVLLWAAFKLSKGRTRAVLKLALLVAGVSLVIASVMVFRDQTQAFYSPLSRAWELLAGAALAIAMQLPQRSQLPEASVGAPLRRWGAACGLLLGLVGGFALYATAPFPGLLALIPVACAVLLILGPHDGWINRLVLAHPLAVGIGKISYPLYLWHWPLLSFAYVMQGGHPGAGLSTALVVLSFVLAWLTYVAVEQPIKRVPRRWAIGGLVGVMAVLGLLGKNVYDRDGLERIRHRKMISLSVQAEQDFADFEKRGLITDAVCNHPFKFPERDVCLPTVQAGDATAVVMGDSHALHAYWGLTQMFDKRGERLLLQGKGACVPFAGFSQAGDANHCQPFIDQTLSAIAADKHVRTVALVFRGRYLASDAPAPEVQKFAAGLERTVQQLLSSHKQVWYFLPVVEPGFDPRLCVGELPLGRKPPYSCTIDKPADDARSAAITRTALEVLKKYPAVRVVDPNLAWCVDGHCPVLVDGHSLFKDDNHISYYGSMLLGRSLEPLVVLDKQAPAH